MVEQLEQPYPQIAGIDPDWESLHTHRMPAFSRAVAFSHQLPFPSNHFDLVLASWVLEHLAQPSEDFQEISRVLKNAGKFIFITPHKRHPLIWLNRAVSKLATLQNWLITRLYGRASQDTFPAYYRANQMQDLRTLGKQTNLQLESFQIIPDPTYYGVFPQFYNSLTQLDAILPSEKQLHLVGCFTKST